MQRCEALKAILVYYKKFNIEKEKLFKKIYLFSLL